MFLFDDGAMGEDICEKCRRLENSLLDVVVILSHLLILGISFCAYYLTILSTYG